MINTKTDYNKITSNDISNADITITSFNFVSNYNLYLSLHYIKTTNTMFNKELIQYFSLFIFIDFYMMKHMNYLQIPLLQVLTHGLLIFQLQINGMYQEHHLN